MKKQKRRYRRYIYGTNYYTYAFSAMSAHKNLILQAKNAIGKFELKNPLEIEDPPKSNLYKKIDSHYLDSPHDI